MSVDHRVEPARDEIELSIVIPCLNEAETLAIVVRKAQAFLATHDMSGEVIVADNGSTDGSRQIANALGARLVAVEARGYGAALIGGIAIARGRFVAMGDADDSYDFLGLMPFVETLRSGADLVMGNRFRGGIARGAMPLLHRYLGNPVLSYAGKLFFGAPIGDFHCGLRAFRRDSIATLKLNSPGMEFASEMVVKAAIHGLDIREVPTTLAKDGRSRPPHLRTWRDGWRHLRFLLTYAPRWLFYYPGVALGGGGAIGLAVLAPGGFALAGVELSITSMLFAAMALLLGAQLLSFGILARLFGIVAGMWPTGRGTERFRKLFTVERGCQTGGVLFAAGCVGLAWLVADWASAGFGPMNPYALMRGAIPSMAAAVLGLQIVFTSFLIGLIDPRQR
ncbi:glycosyltransferase family 2 protein [Sphingomonas sp. AX6]|uniref:glycosyltransferase family 2 protein n=1 Tax=Sphingomonas sp. AX6 TaxID=2653171 RepID=UPI001F2D50A0|nr:glycosyltransferase family 2 protein [Sphingomonas sp. AX6]